MTRGRGMGATPLFLPLLDADETRDELAQIEHDLDHMDAVVAVDPERREELRATRIRWRDRLRQQLRQLETKGRP